MGCREDVPARIQDLVKLGRMCVAVRASWHALCTAAKHRVQARQANVQFHCLSVDCL